MDVYIYRAALLCPDCAEKTCGQLSIVSQASEDSDVSPQGPYSNGGGEADCPQHCDICCLFLENPLTPDGVEYVKERLAAGAEDEMEDVLEEWEDFYDL